MAHRYLAVSDLHLSDVEDNPDGWKAHKGSRFLFDDSFSELVAYFTSLATAGESMTLLLNGDVLDFDVVTAIPEEPPWPVSKAERKSGLAPSATKSVWKLRLILSHHPRFVAALAHFLAAGHTIVYVLGNHDREMHFPEVQEAFLECVRARGQEMGVDATAGAVQFEPWFYYVPGEVYCEHGNQYDHYNSFRYVLSPVAEEEGEQRLALTPGNLSNRLIMNRLGFFNPHSHGEYILGFYRYMRHWLRHYAFTRKSLILTWLWGSILVIAASLKLRGRMGRARPEHEARLRELGERHGLSAEEIDALGELHPAPIGHKLFRLLRGFRIDRAIMWTLMLLATICLVLLPAPLWAKVMVPGAIFPLIYLVYERLGTNENSFSLEGEMPEHARTISETLPARVYIFSHTHIPREIPLARDITFVDTGSWAPITSRTDKDQLQAGLRNYLLASFAAGESRIKLGSWMMDEHHVRRPRARLVTEPLGVALEAPKPPANKAAERGLALTATSPSEVGPAPPRPQASTASS